MADHNIIFPFPNSAQVGDTFQYANGNEYTITEQGPVVMSVCYECGAPAGATFETKLNTIKCSTCWSRHHELQPGQAAYEAKAAYAAAFRARLKQRSIAASDSSYGPKRPSRRG